jgi:hypothetical protein
MLVALCGSAKAQHPIAFFTKTEVSEIKRNLNSYPVLSHSYNSIKKEVDAWVGKDIDVPVPKDPAGGYTHDKHKANYTLMFNSGILYNLTGEHKYAVLVKQMLLKYADLNPTLTKHPQATSAYPGHLFWQSLNDANWLVYAGSIFYITMQSGPVQVLVLWVLPVATRNIRIWLYMALKKTAKVVLSRRWIISFLRMGIIQKDLIMSGMPYFPICYLQQR